MNLPYMTSDVKKERISISTFGGLNRTVSQKNGELTECKNTSGRKYPALSVAKPSGTPEETNVIINGAGSKNGLFYTGTSENDPLTTNMYFGKSLAPLTTSATADKAAMQRSFAHQGDSVLVIPDNKVYNISDNSVYTVEYSKSITLDEAYENAKTECSVKSLDDPATYIGEITSAGLISAAYSKNGYVSYFMTFEEIKAGDVVHISMTVFPKEYDEIDDHYHEYRAKMKAGVDLKITAVNERKYKTASGSVTKITSVEFDENVLDMGGYSIVVITDITISRRVPPLKYLCSLNNRVWGAYDNTVRCSKLGDCSSWYDFTADAYGTLPSSCFCTEVDSVGSFTGIAAYGGGIVAFKENCLHRIYGSDPDSYTLSTLDCHGVKAGCANTIAVIGGTVYYVGSDGVYAYKGTIPELISKKPDLSHINAICAGTDGTNYYLLADEDTGRVMYVYYPSSKSWHKEETDPETHIIVADGNRLYTVSGSKITRICGNEGDMPVKWSFSLKPCKDNYNTYSYGRLFINYTLGKDGQFTVKTVCDGDTRKVNITPEYNHRENAYSVISLPYIGCMDFCIEFEGQGDFTLKNLTMEYTATPEEKGNYI